MTMNTIVRSPAKLVGRLTLASRAMSSWVYEKNLALNAPLVEKRKAYKGKHVTLEDVLAWNVTGSRAPPPQPRDAERFADFQLDAQLNETLAKKVSVWSGSITELEIDAIVNAANAQLRGGGGVDGAIHRAAGPLLLEECKSIGGCPTGQARITGGYSLPAKYIIHTVGPMDKSKDSLTSCYKSCFALQKANELKSIAFPCVGTGVYNFPNVEAAHIACSETRKFLEEDAKERGGLVERVIFCVFEKNDYEIYNSVAQLYFPLK